MTDTHAHVNSSNWINGTTTVTGLTKGQVTGLQPYSNYRFRVRALVTIGGKEKFSVPSQEIHLSTREARKCLHTLTIQNPVYTKSKEIIFGG